MSPSFAGGTVLRGQFDAASLGVTKAYAVYLPRGYSDSNRSYPVIYLLHGHGVNEDTWIAPSLDLPAAADSMGLDAIVVMPDGDRSFYANSLKQQDYDACLKEANPTRNPHEPRTDYCVRTARYEDYIVYDLVRHIDSNYRTIPKREARALSGESAGGAGAIQIAMRHKNMFSAAGSHSGGLARLYEGPHPYDRLTVKLRTDFASYPSGMQEPVEIFGTDISRWRDYDPPSLAKSLKDGELALYFDCGWDDETGAHDHALYFHDRLTGLGIAHRFESIPGRHEEALWKERIKYSLQFHVDHFVRTGVYASR